MWPLRKGAGKINESPKRPFKRNDTQKSIFVSTKRPGSYVTKDIRHLPTKARRFLDDTLENLFKKLRM